MSGVEPFTEPLAFHGEGPVWAPAWGGLRFVDMLQGDVVCLDGAGALVERVHVGAVAAAFRPRAAGGMVVAVERGFALVEEDGTVRALPEVWDDAGVRFNDGATDPQGRFLCGSMAYDMTPGAGALYRLAPDGQVEVVLPAVTCSNGLAWTPDGSLAYYVDSLEYRIDVFDSSPEDGLTGRRPFAEVPQEEGLPDGLTVDAEGGVWVAFYGGSAVRRFGAGGAVEEVLELPVSQVTACTFGGTGLDELYVTTSKQDAEGDQPLAGAVFRARPGVTGQAALPFAG